MATNLYQVVDNFNPNRNPSNVIMPISSNRILTQQKTPSYCTISQSGLPMNYAPQLVEAPTQIKFISIYPLISCILIFILSIVVILLFMPKESIDYAIKGIDTYLGLYIYIYIYPLADQSQLCLHYIIGGGA